MSREEVVERLKAVLADSEHPAWMSALKFATETLYGRPTQRALIGDDSVEPLTIRVVHE